MENNFKKFIGLNLNDISEGKDSISFLFRKEKDTQIGLKLSKDNLKNAETFTLVMDSKEVIPKVEKIKKTKKRVRKKEVQKPSEEKIEFEEN